MHTRDVGVGQGQLRRRASPDNDDITESQFTGRAGVTPRHDPEKWLRSASTRFGRDRRVSEFDDRAVPQRGLADWVLSGKWPAVEVSCTATPHGFAQNADDFVDRVFRYAFDTEIA